MAYSIFGKTVDEKNEVIPFSTIYASDSTGKPNQPPNAVTADKDGKFRLDNLTDKDFVTVRMVGSKPVTIPASSVKPTTLPNGISLRTTQIKLVPDESIAQLEEVQVVADKPTKLTLNTPTGSATATIKATFNFGIPLMVLGGIMIIFGGYKLLSK